MKIESGQDLLEMMRAYQVPCVLAAAVDLDIFEKLATPCTASEVAGQAGYDLRGTTILLDALAALDLIVKTDHEYSLPANLKPFLLDDSARSVVAMLHHQGTCLRRWARLPWTVATGAPDDPGPGFRGAEADEAAFIEAMHVVSRAVARELINEINPGGFRCLLDLGGASGSWTSAWLEAEPEARAIIFDLPHVVPMARKRMESAAVASRVDFVEGDFYSDELPAGADLVWISAIIHQNSPEENRALFGRVARVLEPGGWIYIRDIVMHPSRTRPRTGALFAVNMLSATPGGNTYTLAEIEKELHSTGFVGVELVRRDEGMHSVVRARRS